MARAALVTGAAKRVGRELAFALARDGWDVVVHYSTSADAAASVVAHIRAAGGRAAALQADLAREAETETLIDRAGEALGPLSCLINNASSFAYDSIASADRAGWDRHMEINLRAPFVLSQGFARQLPDGVEGNIVNLLDQRVWNLTPHFVTYTLSKAALWTLTQTMALALAPRIRVNGIGPGPVLPSLQQTPEQFQRAWTNTPLRRGGTPDSIARALLFLLAAPAVTGQMIAVDGGQHLGWAQPPADPPPEATPDP